MIARLWFVVGALLVVVALVIQIPITAEHTDGFFTSPAGRVGNLFTFFTILSNLLVGVVDVVLAARVRTRSTLLRVARLDALLAITITGIVYHLLLADLYHLAGAEQFADQLFHTVTPLVTVVGWMLFGPHGWIDRRVIVLALGFPLAWLAFTLIRGAIIGWYPYPFIDVGVLGYGRVALNCAGITALFLAMALVFAGLDRLRGRQLRARTSADSGIEASR